ncbi:MAG: hypothetical protein HY362_03010 [Candidatus Aenigmarchaeota archaeon]|nr:hypothetical protein [Candidatus Aenigmarchaeota archaeon]
MAFNGSAGGKAFPLDDSHLCGREDVQAILTTYKGPLETAMRKDFFSGYCPETRRDLGQRTVINTARVMRGMQDDPALAPYFQSPAQKLEAIGRYVRDIRLELMEELDREATLDRSARD